MNTSTVLALFSSTDQLERTVYHLRDSGFSAESVSLLHPDSTAGTNDLSTVNSTKSPEGAVMGATTLGVLGGIGGFLVGMGALAIPGLGPFLAAGPIMAALGGVAIGATIGGIGGGLIGLGVPEYEAQIYDQSVRNGKTLVAANCVDSKEVAAVSKIFGEMGGTDISICDTRHKTTDRDISHTASAV